MEESCARSWLAAGLTLLLLLLLATAAILSWWGRRRRHLLAAVPTPRGAWPLLGNWEVAFMPREDLMRYAEKIVEETGPIFNVNLMGISRVCLASPESIQKVLSSQDNLTKDTSYHFLDEWLGNGLITSTGAVWRGHRKLLEPAFRFRMQEDFLHVFNANAATLVVELGKLSAAAGPGGSVVIGDYVARCALDNICETAMGTAINAQQGSGAEYVDGVSRVCDLFALRHFSPWLHPDFMFNLSSNGREYKRVMQMLNDFSDKVIKKKMDEYEKTKMHQETEEHDEERKTISILDILLKILNSEDGGLNFQDVKNQVNTFMFAGHDTTAAAIGWDLFLLGSHPTIQAQVFSELSDIFGDSRRPPTMADLARMTTLDKVIKEGLRLFPSVPAISRTLDTDLKIGPFTVPAGTNVMVLTAILHRDPSIYPDPGKFDPDRWSPEGAAGRHPYAFLPFSAGPRNCIGQKFARTEILSVLSTILRAFEVATLDAQQVVPEPAVVLRPKHPVKFRLTPRHD